MMTRWSRHHGWKGNTVVSAATLTATPRMRCRTRWSTWWQWWLWWFWWQWRWLWQHNQWDIEIGKRFWTWCYWFYHHGIPIFLCANDDPDQLHVWPQRYSDWSPGTGGYAVEGVVPTVIGLSLIISIISTCLLSLLWSIFQVLTVSAINQVNLAKIYTIVPTAAVSFQNSGIWK